MISAPNLTPKHLPVRQYHWAYISGQSYVWNVIFGLGLEVVVVGGAVVVVLSLLKLKFSVVLQASVERRWREKRVGVSKYNENWI